jgi:hypothetical protein
MHKFQDYYSALYNNAAPSPSPVICEGWHFTCWKHWHNRIISLSCEVSLHKTSLAPPLCIEVPVPSLESDRSRICVLGVSILIFYFGIVPTAWYFVLFFNSKLLQKYYVSNVCTAYSPKQYLYNQIKEILQHFFFFFFFSSFSFSIENARFT